ncbi:MAG: class II fructose-bisphosphate aldolase [Christensenellaceae bacterium]
MNIRETVQKALEKKTVIPAYNIPYLPMVKPIIQAVIDENSVAMIQVARVEWEKFSSESLEAVAKEYHLYANAQHTFLHLDHVPAIDEDFIEVDYIPIIKRAIDCGFQSVMIDASRLNLGKNIEVTAEVSSIAHAAGIPCEAELGSVMGHESGEMLPYEEIFKTKKGFTDIDEAKEFAQKSNCDWLSVAVGSIHGAVAEATRHQKKPEAKLDIDHIIALQKATNMPLVLHGGSGINKECILKGIANGIAKINVGTELRQVYEQAIAGEKDIEKARMAVYLRTRELITEFLMIQNSRDLIFKR